MFTLPLINVIPIFRPPEQFGTAMQVFTGNADQIDRYRSGAAGEHFYGSWRTHVKVTRTMNYFRTWHVNG